MYTQLIFIMNKCQELGSFTDDQNSKLGAGREQGKAPLIYKVWYKWLSCIFDRILHTCRSESSNIKLVHFSNNNPYICITTCILVLYL